jgi:hypothetical protein
MGAFLCKQRFYSNNKYDKDVKLEIVVDSKSNINDVKLRDESINCYYDFYKYYYDYYNKYTSQIAAIVFSIENNFPNDKIIKLIDELHKSAGTVDIFYKKLETLFTLILNNSRDTNKTYDLCKILLDKYKFDLNKTFSYTEHRFINNCDTFLICHISETDSPNLNYDLIKLFLSYGADLNAISSDDHKTLYDMLSKYKKNNDLQQIILNFGGKSIYDIDLRYKRPNNKK